VTPYLLAVGLWTLGWGVYAWLVWRLLERHWVREWQRLINRPWER
jgi:hypothetical protein